MSTFDDAMRWVAKDNKRKNRERERQQRRERDGQRSGRGTDHVASTFTGTVIGTAYGIAQAVTFAAPTDFLPGHAGTHDQNWAESTAITERDQRSRQMDQETRARGGRHRWTSQQ